MRKPKKRQIIFTVTNLEGSFRDHRLRDLDYFRVCVTCYMGVYAFFIKEDCVNYDVI